MNTSFEPAAEGFARLRESWLQRSGVTRGTGFGSTDGLRVNGRIFAMLMGGALVLKLPVPRVDELIATAGASRMQSGRGSAMKEWVVVPWSSEGDWESLCAEAFAFVAPPSAGE